MKRLPDWQERLSRYLAGVSRAAFEPGVLDCALFVDGAVQAQTGESFSDAWKGQYTTLEEGFQLLMKHGFDDHVALVASVLSEVPVSAALPGDIAVLLLGRNLPSLGIVQGTGVYVLLEDHSGFIVLPVSQASRAFRVPQ